MTVVVVTKARRRLIVRTMAPERLALQKRAEQAAAGLIVCARRVCKNTLGPERVEMGAVYCSHRCKRRAGRENNPRRAQYEALRLVGERAALGQPVFVSIAESLADELTTLGEEILSPERLRALNAARPYEQFAAATKRATRVQVPPAKAKQRAARRMVGAGWCAYENRRGVICDVGLPLDESDAGRVWSLKGVKPRKPPWWLRATVNGKGR